jgi:general secretion pathway protein A
MYLDFYRLKKNPFHITPDPEFLFLSSSHKEASASLVYGIEERKGFISITGEIGVGKTTILRSYLESADPEKLKVVYIFNAMLSFESLLRQIFNELGLVPDQSAGVPELVTRFHRFLIEEYKNDRNVVLIIDEVQNMPVETLENLRMLSNLETSKDKLVQIVMVGQPEFDQKLELTELRQLKQRIAIRCLIKPLSRDESFAYILHRLMKGSHFHNQVFTKGALKRIVKEARGFPRRINILCDNALITGFGYQRNPVGESIIKEVISDFRGPKSRKLFRAFPVAAVSAGIILLGVFLTQPLENRPEKEASQVPYKAAVKVELPAPPPSDLPVPQQVPVIVEAPKVQQQASELVPPKKIESIPESQVNPLPKKQLVGVEPAEKSADVPKQEPLLTTGSSEAPKERAASERAASERAASERTVIKGENVSRVLVETYGYYDPDLMKLFKEANPQIKDVNRIMIGDQLKLPQMASPKSRPR